MTVRFRHLLGAFVSTAALFVLNPDPSASTHGVIPDIPVRRTADDVRSGRDPALERAPACALGLR